MEQKQNVPYKKRPIRIEGHRGAGFLHSENTLEAFKRGVALDLDGVEFDVFVDKDGVPIVLHGDDHYKTEFTDTSKNGFPHDFAYDDMKDLESKHGGTIPTLKSVLAICKSDLWPNIELKDQDPRVVEPVVKTVIEMGMLNQVVYSSFGHHLRSELAKVYEKLKIETPFCFGYLCWQFEELLTISYESQHDSINIDYALYQKDKEKVIDAINKAKAKGMKVKFYIPRPYQENLDDFKNFKELGVDTVITDFPIEALELAKQVEA